MRKSRKPTKKQKRVAGETQYKDFQIPIFQSTDERVAARIKAVKNPARRSSFGFASECFLVESDTKFHYGFLTIPVASSLLHKNEINPVTLQLFRWDEETKAFRLVPGSGIDPEWKTVSGHITGPAIYTVIGLSSNPWVQATVDIFWRLAPLLKDPQLRELLVPPICNLILCAGPPFQRASKRLDLDKFPQGYEGNLCELCLGLGMNGYLPEFGILETFETNIPIKYRRPDKFPTFHLDDWLNNHLTIANAIVWREPGPVSAVNGVPKSYPNWTKAQKGELADVFREIRAGSCPGLSMTPQNTLTLHTNGELFGTELDPAVAWPYFVAYVAQSLAVEVEGWIPWSLSSYSGAELELLLDSHSLFEYSSTLGKYGVLMQHNVLFNHGAAMPGDPCRIYGLLRDNKIIGSTAHNSIDNMLEWCRANLMHFYGDFQPTNLQAHWQYEGWPPVERMFSGTTHAQYGFGHWTGGCWGTTGFLHTVLRTCNIPVALQDRCGHALPAFVHEKVYLSHGDDPYNWFAKATPPIPIADLLIDQTTFDSWFGSAVSASSVCNNVGRRIRQLAVQYLPNELLRMHCRDLAAGRTPAQSDVYNQSGLSWDYTLAQLLALNLWSGMDAKIASFGGCAQIPYP